MIRRKMVATGFLGLVGMALFPGKTLGKRSRVIYSRSDYELSNGDYISLHFVSEKHEADLDYWRHTCMEMELTKYSPLSSSLWLGLKCHEIIETWVQSGHIEKILSGRYYGVYVGNESSGLGETRNYHDFVHFRKSYHKRTV